MSSIIHTPQLQAPALVCPSCSSRLPGVVLSCPACDEDLTALAALADLAPRHYNLALGLAQAGRYSEAADHLHAVLAFDPGHVAALVVLGKLAAQQADYGRALGYWQRALALDPDNAAAQAGAVKARKLIQQQQAGRRWRSGGLAVLPVLFILLAMLLRRRLPGVR